MPFELVDVSELAEEIGTTLLVEAENERLSCLWKQKNRQ